MANWLGFQLTPKPYIFDTVLAYDAGTANGVGQIESLFQYQNTVPVFCQAAGYLATDHSPPDNYHIMHIPPRLRVNRKKIA